MMDVRPVFGKEDPDGGTYGKNRDIILIKHGISLNQR